MQKLPILAIPKEVDCKLVPTPPGISLGVDSSRESCRSHPNLNTAESLAFAELQALPRILCDEGMSKPKTQTLDDDHKRKNDERCLAPAMPKWRRLCCRVGLSYLALRLGIAVFHRMRRRNLQCLVTQLCKVLDAAGVTYWLDFGSLLGVYRDGDLILHDNDVDIAILDADWIGLLPILKTRLEPRYRVKVVTPNTRPDSTWLRIYCPLAMADLFRASQLGHEAVHVDCGHADDTHIPTRLILPTNRLSWQGGLLSVPCNPPAVLEIRYGAGWRRDVVEGQKVYTKIFRALARVGLRI